MKAITGKLLLFISAVFLSFSSLINAQVFTTRGTKLISPEGEHINLCGWRFGAGEWDGQSPQITQENLSRFTEQGLLGNAQGIEIWWSRGTENHPSEAYPQYPGVYQEENLSKLMDALRAVARSGSYIIPSIRVSFDGKKATTYTLNGKTGWEGWASHKKLIYNDPVVIDNGPDAGTYGKYQDRFFAWLDWLIPAILADNEIASHIAYWEIWHFFGHRHIGQLNNADYNQYFDVFIPNLIAKFREYDPERLLGVSARSNFVMDHLLARIEAGTWTPWDDKNWILVYGGYGFHNQIMRDMNLKKNWPEDCINPAWLPETKEFDVQKYIRLTGLAVHSQEGPGLWKTYRKTPIPEPQRTFLVGLFNLYNENINGFAFHGFPVPLSSPDTEDLRGLMRKALKGELVE